LVGWELALCGLRCGIARATAVTRATVKKCVVLRRFFVDMLFKKKFFAGK
jgi:hypothetical protein